MLGSRGNKDSLGVLGGFPGFLPKHLRMEDQGQAWVSGSVNSTSRQVLGIVFFFWNISGESPGCPSRTFLALLLRRTLRTFGLFGGPTGYQRAHVHNMFHMHHFFSRSPSQNEPQNISLCDSLALLTGVIWAHRGKKRPKCVPGASRAQRVQNRVENKSKFTFLKLF